MAIEIRRATTEDTGPIGEIIGYVWGETVDSARIAAIISSREHDTWVAVCDGKAAAFVDSFPTRSAEGVARWEVDLLAVHPDFQGRGLARKLVAASAAEAGRRGLALARGLRK